MKEYRQSTMSWLGMIILYIAALGLMVVYFDLNWIFDVFFSVMVIFAILNQIKVRNNYFQLENETLKYFKKNKLAYEWNAREITISYNVKRSRRNTEAEFVIHERDKDTTIEVSHLKHELLYNDLQAFRETPTLEFDGTSGY